MLQVGDQPLRGVPGRGALGYVSEVVRLLDDQGEVDISLPRRRPLKFGFGAAGGVPGPKGSRSRKLWPSSSGRANGT